MASISTSRGARSSSSSASSSDGFAALLEASLAALARECPDAYRAMLGRLDGAMVLLEVGDESVVVIGRSDGHELRAPADDDGPPTATLTATSRTLLDLLDGEATVLDCLLEDRLVLSGA